MTSLQEIAVTIRKDIIKMISKAQSGHPGGSLSSVEILVLLYFEIMNLDVKDFQNKNRDKFILSKGHAAPLLYSVLARKGFFDISELNTLRALSSRLQGHPDMHLLPGIEISTGSLGHGISAAVGIALAQKIDKINAYTYALTGDGELDEGIVWEAAMAAAHYNLKNLIVFVDYNGLQIDGNTCDVMNLGDVYKKFDAFGFNTIYVDDGHDFEKLRKAVDQAKKSEFKPSAIICKTIKGKGVSFMENNAAWHGKAPSEEQTKQALAELEAM
jgi:transketolase